ncbi:MAG: hypothetical protein GX142_04635 [Chloroflexi bacterium]|nr:hypothetical protein [Chloroflexota bacterium]
MHRLNLKMIFLFVGFFLLVSIACGTSKTPDPTIAVPTEEPVDIVTEPIVEVVETPEEIKSPNRQVQPTEAAPFEVETPLEDDPEFTEAQAYYIEEFDGDLSSYSYFLMNGDENLMDLYTDYGRLVFYLQGRNQYVYVLYEEFYYSDVAVEIYAENLAKNTNNVSLICNYSDRFGWYEFNVSNGGLYDILIYSELDGGYINLASGGSKNVHQGRDVNVYTAVCQGNQLALYINGILEKEFVDKKYNLREGQVGFGVSSFDVLPILVEVDYFSISQP